MDSTVSRSPLQTPAPNRARLSPNDAARLLGVTPATIRRWVADGLLPAKRLGPGRRIVIEPADLDRLVTSSDPVGDRSEEVDR